MRILIAEDNFTDRLILKKIVEDQGHDVIEAQNGREALDFYERYLPELILLDALMPEMDGFEVAQRIKSSETKFIPIIFITSLTETEALIKCLDAGGDDFFVKPFNKVVLQAKIKAFERTQQLYSTVRQQHDKLQFHSEHLIQEQKVAKRIFDNVAHKGALEESYIQYSVSPMSIFNGDILLAAIRPLGGLNVFIGDFTGHGLPAAIGALPVSEIFFDMTEKGFELYEIIREINNRLNFILPTGFFCCAIAMQIDFENNTLQFWNGGLPEAYTIDKNTGNVEALPSTHLPLGILNKESFKVNMEVRSFNEGESIFAYSDGLIEAENEHQEQFGRDRLLIKICEAASESAVFQSVQNAIESFHLSNEQGDDITFVEIKNHKEVFEGVFDTLEEELKVTGPSDAFCHLRLGVESLKSYNPLPYLTQLLMEIGNLRSYSTQVLTILTELYSNALEHGVLQLSSDLKNSPDGFAEYYRQREQRLSELKDGFVSIKIEHENLSDGGCLTIWVHDSGAGFNYKKMMDKSREKKTLSGRGYPLIVRLAESVEFSEGGTRVKVVYNWKVSQSGEK